MIEAKKIYGMLVIAFLLFIYGCETSECPDYTSRPSRESLEEAVETNCLIVQAAVEEFAAQNHRGYPVHILEDTTDTGLTAIDLLPDGKRLVNPFTGQPTEPVDRRAAYPGEVGYEEYGLVWDRFCPGYTITGCGWDSVIVVLTNLDALDDSVRANCYRVQQAAEQFARLNGAIYPLFLGDTTPSGDNLIDLLPGGTRLMNPFTGCCTEPVDAVACIIGETGYTVVCPAGMPVGYVITGAGHDRANIIITLSNIGSDEETSVWQNCIVVLHSAGWFAQYNDGIFPLDIDVDANRTGDTLMDIIMRMQRDLLWNPYSNQYEWPVDRRASNPGETGYEPVLEGGVPVACIVTGVGAVADSLIVEFDSREYYLD